MIKFNNISGEAPYKVLKGFYNDSLKAKQENMEAITIASYSLRNKEVNARFVNLKFVNDKEFIFFSNYNSPKSKDFKTHDQITALIYWNRINVQIRMKAKIKKTNQEFNKSYFLNRDPKKNALAISSNQSKVISSYEAVKDNYETILKDSNLSECPNYWGGFSFVPYYFEFWEGHELRLNKRHMYQINNGEWKHSILQP